MSEKDREELKGILREAFAELVQPKLEEVEKKLTLTLRRRNLALITAMLCLIAAAFSAGYALNSRHQLREQINTNETVVCANARSTALAFRERQISASGQKETREHFLERMIGQRETLLAASSLKCPDIPGFDTFEYLRGKALSEIDRILRQEAPNRYRRLKEQEESLGSLPGEAAPSPSSPPAASPASGPQSPAGPPAPAGDGTASPPKHPPQGGSGGGNQGGGKGNEGGAGGGAPEGVEGGAGGAGGTGGEGGEAGGGGEEAGGSAAGGVVGDPGGIVGEVVCTVNKLGVRLCSEP